MKDNDEVTELVFALASFGALHFILYLFIFGLDIWNKIHG